MKEVDEEKKFTLEAISKILVDVTNENVHIIGTEEYNEVKLHYYGTAMQEIKLAPEVNGNELAVRAQNKHGLPHAGRILLDIYIPRSFGKEFSIKTSVGSVKADSFESRGFFLSSGSGRLDIGTIKADQIAINTSSGKANIVEVEAKNFNFNGRSGELSIEKCKADQAVFETNTGNLNIKKIDANDLKIKGKTSAISIGECIAKAADVETSTGSITLKGISGAFEVKASMGKVSVDYNEFENQTINIETVSGNVALRLPYASEFLVEARSSTGRFHSDFPIALDGKHDSCLTKGRVGLKNNKVWIKTTTGSIEILKK